MCGLIKNWRREGTISQVPRPTLRSQDKDFDLSLGKLSPVLVCKKAPMCFYVTSYLDLEKFFLINILIFALGSRPMYLSGTSDAIEPCRAPWLD